MNKDVLSGKTTFRLVFSDIPALFELDRGRTPRRRFGVRDVPGGGTAKWTQAIEHVCYHRTIQDAVPATALEIGIRIVHDPDLALTLDLFPSPLLDRDTLLGLAL